jgi:RNA polymerase sigma factor (sigma-70 family)
MHILTEKCTFYEKNGAFLHLINFFAHMLRDPHGAGELWSFLWLTMQKYPDKPPEYYKRCLRNEWLRMAKEESQKTALPDDLLCNTRTPDMCIDLREILHRLSGKQSAVLRLHYVGGYSVDEISKMTKISRQAVNQTKQRGLAEMRKKISL